MNAMISSSNGFPSWLAQCSHMQLKGAPDRIAFLRRISSFSGVRTEKPVSNRECLCFDVAS